MVALRKSIDIAAPPARVYDYLQRLERAPRWQPSLLRAVRADGDGPLCEGAWFDAVSVACGARFEWRARTTRAVPHAALAWRQVAGDLERCEERYDLQHLPDGRTRVRFAADIELPFVMPRLVTEAEVREELSRKYDQALLNLKDLVEAY